MPAETNLMLAGKRSSVGYASSAQTAWSALSDVGSWGNTAYDSSRGLGGGKPIKENRQHKAETTVTCALQPSPGDARNGIQGSLQNVEGQLISSELSQLFNTQK